jgi:hypothetical protein
MLLNEFLKEHRKVEEQGREMQEQKAIAARQQKQIEALTAGLQKVSAQLEASKPAPQTVLNRQRGDGEILGNHRRQAQRGWLEFGLGLSR